MSNAWESSLEMQDPNSPGTDINLRAVLACASLTACMAGPTPICFPKRKQ